MKKIFFLIFISLIFYSTSSFAQNNFNLSLKVDTSVYTSGKNFIKYQGKDFLYIQVNENRELCELEISAPDTIEHITLKPTSFITIVDSLHRVDNRWYGVIKFENLSYSKNPVLNFQYILNGVRKEAILNILPIFETKIQYQEEMYEVYQEEEKLIEIPTKNSFNIITDNIWYVTEDYDYKTSYSSGILSVTIKPHTLGNKQIILNLKTFKPVMNALNQPGNELPSLTIKFNVKPNQLYYLNSDKPFIYADTDFKNFETILIDYNRNLSLNKTYRIEDSPSENGNLIAEMVPLSVIENKSKVLCKIKPYSLHRVNEGYLYLKEENRSRFITNFNIWAKPRITGLFLRRESGDWTSTNTVYPGEDVEVRIEGKGLDNTKIQFGGIPDAVQDTLRISDEAVFYRIKIPITITYKHIALSVNKSPTTFELNVKEHQKPAPLDFVSINYGYSNIALTNDKLNKPVFYEEVLNDINLVFNPSKIDENQKLYGKQYLKIQVKIFNSKNDLVEIQEIDNVVVCPGENSPRKLFYDNKDCRQDAISLNDYLIHKTYRLEPFSQLEINIVENESKYGTSGYSKKVKIILTRKVHFDIQVSFPAGLLVKRLDERGLGNLSGISTSILAQFNFYDPRQIGKLRPYNIGAGFIALNAFNFSNSTNNLRDIGIVILGSVSPMRREKKFSIPIYAGGGYLLKANTWFLVFGPGFQLNF